MVTQHKIKFHISINEQTNKGTNKRKIETINSQSDPTTVRREARLNLAR